MASASSTTAAACIFVFVRRPWGTMAERAAAPRKMCIPVPEKLDDVQAAAIANPGMSAWLSLKERAAVAAGETVLIMGATGVAGQLAIQSARLLGAKRVIAAGRNVDALADADVDAIIALGQPEDAIRDALAAEAASGIDVVVDYLVGPAHGAAARSARHAASRRRPPTRTRLVEVGASAGRTITLPGRSPAQHRSHPSWQRLWRRFRSNASLPPFPRFLKWPPPES